MSSIQSLIRTEAKDKAIDSTGKFAKLVRMVLENSREELISLKDEEQVLKLYLDLEIARTPQGFSYEISFANRFDGKIDDVLLPPMLIQPFVENAIWHGLNPKQAGDKKIEIRFDQQQEFLVVSVADNGVGRTAASENKVQTSHKSLGLTILKERLESIDHTYATQADLKMIDLKDEQGNSSGTRVELILPLIEE